MLEIFDAIQGKPLKEAMALVGAHERKYPKFLQFIKGYLVDADRILSPNDILKMMRYYRIESERNISKIGEIGEFAARKSMALKEKEFLWVSNTKYPEIKMNNISFLLDTYIRLKRNVSHRARYKCLKNCFTLLSETDTKWFTRMICRKFTAGKPILEMIKKKVMAGEL